MLILRLHISAEIFFSIMRKSTNRLDMHVLKVNYQEKGRCVARKQGILCFVISLMYSKVLRTLIWSVVLNC